MDRLIGERKRKETELERWSDSDKAMKKGVIGDRHTAQKEERSLIQMVKVKRFFQMWKKFFASTCIL